MADGSLKTEGALDSPQISAPEDAPTSEPSVPAPATLDMPQKDVVMSDAPVDQSASPAPAPHVPSPAPARTGTPAHGSRAASVHPDPGFTMPSEAAPHGDATRQYLNTKVTGALLEGMKQLAKNQPTEPLRVLGEFLLQKSKELEGTSS
ncbi:hypothetical protein S7711_09851 [Stachybotrys chartarum IBT 7711]|uniref:Uncharacterized protein n=1 Tax=Stachybotrys chartarum (strain CBS 109288 / IBT 7711) TaxID=1280523 RepID=A0A084AEV8_STACB|nr:hypothetical protein S7711_09851 [Stachybotrys chartarum IBT 7711]KFA46640.1 hypothetical protein S40293_08199 [Stachybotrys chartarum IBT 40293]